MSRNAVLAAVLLPLLAIVLGILRAEQKLDASRDYVFDIQGFDPRDLLRGHYLQFRLRVDENHPREACDPQLGQSCCLCLTRLTPELPPLVQRASCATARAQCSDALQLRYLTEPQRFYVPEAHASKLEKRLFKAMDAKRAQVVLAIDKDGQAMVRELLLEGKAIPGGVGR